MRVHIIRTDGSEAEAHVPDLSGLADLIGAEVLDSVNLRDGRRMYVDDHGYDTTSVCQGPGHYELVPTQALKPANAKATALYHSICKPGTDYEIVGDVGIVEETL